MLEHKEVNDIQGMATYLAPRRTVSKLQWLPRSLTFEWHPSGTV